MLSEAIERGVFFTCFDGLFIRNSLMYIAQKKGRGRGGQDKARDERGPYRVRERERRGREGGRRLG